MNVVLFGATGMIGSRILSELLSRGHHVKAVLRDAAKGEPKPRVEYFSGDIFSPASVTEAARGADAVISAYGPGTNNPELLLPATESLIEGVKASGVKRLLVIGGAGTLEVSPGLTLIDSGFIPPEWLPIAKAHLDALNLIRTCDLDWTSLSPAGFIEPGQRTGHFRLSDNALLTDTSGQSRISAEDFAIAMVDELEKNEHVRNRFGVAY